MKDTRFYWSSFFVIVFIIIVAGNSFGSESKISDYGKGMRYRGNDVSVKEFGFYDFKANLLMEFPNKVMIESEKNYTIFYDDFEKDFFIKKEKYKVSIRELIDVYENYELEYRMNNR